MLTIPTSVRSWISLARLLAALLLALASGGFANAQESPTTTAKYEAAGAFSYMRANSTNSGPFDLYGGSGEFTYRFRSWFEVIADAGAYRFRGLPISSTMYTYAAGPRVTVRKHRHFTPFAEALIGGGRLTASSGGVHAGENSFVFLAGGGVDVPLSHHFAIRAAQTDYLFTKFALTDGTSATQHHLRVSCGVVYRFGER